LLGDLAARIDEIRMNMMRGTPLSQHTVIRRVAGVKHADVVVVAKHRAKARGGVDFAGAMCLQALGRALVTVDVFYRFHCTDEDIMR
jgi:hypothetical protein